MKLRTMKCGLTLMLAGMLAMSSLPVKADGTGSAGLAANMAMKWGGVNSYSAEAGYHDTNKSVSGNAASDNYLGTDREHSLDAILDIDSFRNGQAGERLISENYISFGYFPYSLVKSENVKDQLSNQSKGFYDIEGQRYWVNSNGSVYNCVPLRWRVVADEGDSLLLLQDYVLRSREWDSSSEGSDLTWENSEIRSFLNSDNYLSSYFTAEEQADIIPSSVVNTAVGDTSAAIADTSDKVYLPSAEEMITWFPEAENRKAHYYTFSEPSITTPISGFGDTNAYNRSDFTCAYWTRTPANLNYGMLQPAIVSSEGNVGSYSRVYNTWEMGLRPLIRISKDSGNYYQIPKEIGLSFENGNGVLETYPSKQYRIPVIVTGDNVPEGFHPMISGMLWTDTGGHSTGKAINDDLTVDISVGSYRVECSLYGIESEPVTVEIILNVKPMVENITVSPNASDNALEISWLSDYESPGYEISRSTAKDGEYEVIYTGAVSGLNRNGSSLMYMDSDVQYEQRYWYKVRGLIYADGEYLASYNGMVSEYSDAVSGKLGENNLDETEVPEEKIADAVLYVPYEYFFGDEKEEIAERKAVYDISGGTLPQGMELKQSGELSGIPMETGRFQFTVNTAEEEKSYLLIVQENTDTNAEAATDTGYEIIERVPDFSGDDISDHTLVSVGEYSEFRDVYIDGVKLIAGDDYTSEAGSTRVTIRSETLARFSQPGSHTIVVEFRTNNNHDLKRAVQNYYVFGEENEEGEENGNSGSNGNGAVDGQAATADSASTVIDYIVQPNDNLWKISAKFFGDGSHWRQIYMDNTNVIRNPNSLRVGWHLKIYLTAGNGLAGAAVSTPDTVFPNTGNSYVVQQGDNLWKIAGKVYGKTGRWREIYEANRSVLPNPERIYTKQVLIIP